MSARIHSRDVFRALAGSELPDWPRVHAASRQRRLRRGETLFEAGEARAQVFVVLDGVLTMAYDTAGGDRWIKGFAEAGVCFASLTALDPDGVTSFSARAEQDSCVEQIEYALLQQLAERHPAWQRAVAEAFKRYGRRKEQRERELLTLSPEQRYLAFVQQHPALASVLRQRDIASYVRVTPVALSRILARLRRRGAVG